MYLNKVDLHTGRVFGYAIMSGKAIVVGLLLITVLSLETLGEPSLPPCPIIASEQWLNVLRDITSRSGDDRTLYLNAVRNYATQRENSAIEKIRNGQTSSAINDTTIGLVLGWYASELSNSPETQSWIENRKALMDARRVYQDAINLTPESFNASFHNLNMAAQTLRLPAVADKNGSESSSSDSHIPELNQLIFGVRLGGSPEELLTLCQGMGVETSQYTDSIRVKGVPVPGGNEDISYMTVDMLFNKIARLSMELNGYVGGRSAIDRYPEIRQALIRKYGAPQACKEGEDCYLRQVDMDGQTVTIKLERRSKGVSQQADNWFMNNALGHRSPPPTLTDVRTVYTVHLEYKYEILYKKAEQEKLAEDARQKQIHEEEEKTKQRNYERGLKQDF